jgi:DNA-binding NarL/FixJ family response regulator
MKIISFDTTSHARKLDARDVAVNAIRQAESDYETRPVNVQPAEQDSISMMSSAATLIVADDHPLFRAALREAVTRLLPQAHIIEAGSLEMLEEAVQSNPTADLILLDLRMPGAHGFSALVHLRARYPSIPVAVISAAESASIVRRSLEFGASGFIPKSTSIEKIGAMLRALLDGKLALPEDYVEPASDRGQPDREMARRVSRLTPQQLRVLFLLAEGHSNKTIAQDLRVSEATVKAHVTVILRKLDLERRTQAALLAQRLFRTEPSNDSDSAIDMPDAGDE